MSLTQAVLLLIAGLWAGAINAVVGSGSLVTFPTLLAFGIPPVTANVSNNLGLVPGGFAATWGYRRELAQAGRRLRSLLPATALGALIGSLLLIVVPQAAFRAVVPVLILIGLLLVVFGPAIQRRLRREEGAHETPGRRRLLWGGVLATGVYGGYFGAAQGVILMGILGSLLTDPLQRLNALKNGLATTANVVAATVFLLVARSHIDWAVVGVVALGSVLGGTLGARFGRRLPTTALRAIIVVVGTVALAKFVLS